MFRNRKDAGRQLARKLLKFKKENPLVIGLPRGGVVVADPVARSLQVPLETLVVRKVGAPKNREYAIGALVEGGYSIFNEDAIERLGILENEVMEVFKEESRELARRAKLYRGKRGVPDFSDKTVILVDDGLATGMTAEASVGAVLERGARRVIFAAPVCAQDSVEEVEKRAEVVCLESPADLTAIGNYYQDFSQVTDEEVVNILRLGV